MAYGNDACAGPMVQRIGDSGTLLLPPPSKMTGHLPTRAIRRSDAVHSAAIRGRITTTFDMLRLFENLWWCECQSARAPPSQ
ncbi:hypothetical protein MTO96_013176 [Rhipicephalus appendiculatus]